MTPCEEKGYKVGDRFEVVEDSAFVKGSIIELIRDDRTDCPKFKLVSGSADKPFEGELELYEDIDYIRPISENAKPTEPDWSKAPEGATHAGWDGNGKEFCWYKMHESGYEYMYGSDHEWDSSEGQPIHQPLIPRPSTREGLPEVGEECEFNHPDFGWTGCEIVGHYKGLAVCAPNGGGFYGGMEDEFRPIPRTITIGDMEVPEPVREPLEKGQSYFIPFNGYRGHQICVWDGVDLDYLRLKQNIVHLSLDNANLHFSALIKASGGEVE